MLGAVVIIAWAILWCFPIFAGLKLLGVLRVPLEMELAGMDIAKHNERAYPASAWEDGQQRLGPLDNKISSNWMYNSKIAESPSSTLSKSTSIILSKQNLITPKSGMDHYRAPRFQLSSN